MFNPDKTYSVIMPRVKLTPIKQKTIKEEVKEIIQDPNDPLAKFPLRALGYSNEVGAAVSAMPVWGRAAEVALWVPALMYLGADIYDKYKRGKEGDYTNASAEAAVKQAIFQALASVVLPTAAVKMGQNVAGYTARFDGSGLSATSKEEMFSRLLNEFDNYSFAKGDIIEADGTVIKGIDRVKQLIINKKLKPALVSTRNDLQTEGLFAKIIRFFAHSDRPVSSAKTNQKKVLDFVEKEVDIIFDKQTLFENSTREEIVALNDKKLLRLYDKAAKNAQQRAQLTIEQKPEFVIKKILNSNSEELKEIVEEIGKTHNSISSKRLLVRQHDVSAQVLTKLMHNEKYRTIINEYTKRLEISRTVLRNFIKNKTMGLGILKTAGGFAALTCLAVPIDNFVHNYIIKKFIEPGIENVKNFQFPRAFRQFENVNKN